MDLVLYPSGSIERYYFSYGTCSEIHITINKNSTEKFCLYLYDEFKREYCSLDFTVGGINTIVAIKRINHITEYRKEFGRNVIEAYSEIKSCLNKYLPEYVYRPHEGMFKSIIDEFIIGKSL